MKRLFSASMDQLHDILQFIRSEIEKSGFRGPFEIQLELALEEAIVNIIKYAYPDSKGKIKIQCVHLPQTGIKVILSDKGIPFNPLLKEYKKDKVLIEKVQPVGGLGIFLILSIMDHVEYEFNDGWNILTLTKFFSA